ncbi:serine hydrolase domain-containing protein [Paenibacillus ihbetae]|uniref:Serine hydrolase n=1 Tax=Paenibacillus ihbetae TaxID=1870820 RepID=A0ABX3JNR4_9BACL|nr:serine hydrolase [Paenibacillus ihbetae]OOC58469.1 serine hydrolase [Paenibacillus ihbetae]
MERIISIPKGGHQGLSAAAINSFFTRLEQQALEVNHFILLEDGRTAAEFYRPPYRKDCPQLLYSLSKSFTSIATGIAWDQGYLELHDPVISFFPDELPERVSPNLVKMTVHHLLSMSTGHLDNIYPAIAGEENWVRAFLAQEVEVEPGERYCYTTHATYMLAAIIEKVTGQGLVDFLMPRLFEPLGIPRPAWETCPMGIAAGGMGLSLTTENVARFGQMLLNRGIFDGKRIVSERYIELAASEQSDNRPGVDRVDWAQGYGYQFHLCRRGCYRGDGSFGQMCFVAPHANIVIAVNASFKSMARLQVLLDLIYEELLDYKEIQQPGDADGPRLPLITAPVSSKEPEIRPIPAGVPDLHLRSYLLSDTDNPQGLNRIAFCLQDSSKLALLLGYGREEDCEQLLEFDFTQPVQTRQRFHKDLSMPLQEVVAYAAWLDKRTLRLTLYYIETPYVVTYTMMFEGESIELHFHINVSFHLSDFRASGRLMDP